MRRNAPLFSFTDEAASSYVALPRACSKNDTRVEASNRTLRLVGVPHAEHTFSTPHWRNRRVAALTFLVRPFVRALSYATHECVIRSAWRIGSPPSLRLSLRPVIRSFSVVGDWTTRVSCPQCLHSSISRAFAPVRTRRDGARCVRACVQLHRGSTSARLLRALRDGASVSSRAGRSPAHV